MNPVDPGRISTVSQWVGIPSWYERKARTTGETVPKRPGQRKRVVLTQVEKEVRDMLGMDYGGEWQEAGEVSEYDEMLEAGNFGRIFSGPMPMRTVYFNRWVYYAECPCGQMKVLTAEEIVERDRAGFGCCGRYCTAPDLRYQIWYMPRVALHLQVLQIKALMPEKLPHSGVGLNPAKYVSMLREREEVSDSISKGRWWLKNLAETENIMQDQIWLSGLPDEKLFPNNEIHIRVGGWPMPLDEVCEMYGCRQEDVLRLRLVYEDDSQLIDKLLGGQDE